MPLSNDNQDYGASDKKNEQKQHDQGAAKANQNNTLTTDDLKGKKVDADPEKETDKPANT